jgi:hypothetical protein
MFNEFFNKLGNVNFPKEVVNIIFDYYRPHLPKFSQQDLEKFEEARKVGQLFFNDYNSKEYIVYELEHCMQSKPLHIFNSVFIDSSSPTDPWCKPGQEKVLQEIDRYEQACESVLNTNIITLSDGESLEIILYKKVGNSKMFKNHKSTNEVWEKFKILSYVSETSDLKLGDLYTIIHNCQTSGGNYQGSIFSLGISYDYNSCKFTLLVKLR